VATERETLLRDKLLLAFDLHEAGVLMYRARLGREHPELATDEIDARVVAWLLERPGAEFGDAVGRGQRGWPGEKTP
jgi:hypothetical protein